METEIDTLKNKGKKSVGYSRIKRRVLSHVTLVRVSAILLIVAFLYFTGSLVFNYYKKVNATLYIKTLNNFLTSPTGQLASSNNRTNILIMGKAGGSHDGPDLTDTIMLVSVFLDTNQVKIVSIPRDVWIPEIRAKINSSYYWGNKKSDSEGDVKPGISFAKAVVSGVVGVPVQYGVVVDFSGFKDVIDELGGIEVDVKNAFTDELYPVSGKEDDTCGGRDPFYKCRYETLNFVQGRQLMNGDTALKFVRSRHAEGIEGTDIAREARQQKVIDAIKNKLSDSNTYKNPKKDLAILKVVLNSIDTDMDYPTAAIVARRLYDSKDSVESFLIPPEMLINPPISEKYDMQSVFIPKLGNGKWEDIQKWIKSLL